MKSGSTVTCPLREGIACCVVPLAWTLALQLQVKAANVCRVALFNLSYLQIDSNRGLCGSVPPNVTLHNEDGALLAGLPQCRVIGVTGSSQQGNTLGPGAIAGNVPNCIKPL